jgi:Tfp pilus assembly protein PilF
MPPTRFRHGCLWLLAGGLGVAAAGGEDTVRVRSRTFDIEYAVNENALPLDAVQLWYTQDDGATWHEYGYDEDRHSPVTFSAPGEGAFGFFLVFTNATGASSGPPTPSTKPQQRALVDFTPPVVQLHPVRQTTQLGQRIVQIRWTAVDSQLTVRPLEIAYQRPPETTWKPVVAEPLSNTGRYDWRVPDELNGSLALRLTVSDLGGHRVESERQIVELMPGTTQPDKLSVGAVPAAGKTDATADADAALPGSKRAKERIAKLMAEAAAHREHGEYVEGIARLREAVKLDPQRTEAFAEMADMLYRVGDLDRALNAYEIALKQRPHLRAALQGAAMVDRERKNYSAAADRLRTILRYNPNDAEVWMNLGDVAVYQGDEVLARECYTRATRIDPAAAKTITEAKQRLALMTETSRGFRANGK